MTYITFQINIWTHSLYKNQKVIHFTYADEYPGIL